MANVKFYAGTLAKYQALGTKDANTLYFIEDAGKIFKGETDVTSDTKVVDVVPGSLAEGKVNFVKVTANDKIMYDVYVGDAANTPVKALPGTVDDKAAFADAATFGSYTATVSAVKGFVEEAIANTTANTNKALISGTFANGRLTFKAADTTVANTNIDLTGVANNISWDKETFQLTVHNYGEEAPLEINIPKDFFLQDGKFEPEHSFTPETGDPYTSPAIVLTVNINNGGVETAKEIAIPVKDLVDTYTVGSTDTVTLTMNKNNITAAVKFDTAVTTETEKLLVKTAKGLAAGPVSIKDLKDAMDTKDTAVKKAIEAKLPGTGEAGKVIVSTATGETRSTMVLGGEAIAVAPNATTLATEKAVSDKINAAVNAGLTWNTL